MKDDSTPGTREDARPSDKAFIQEMKDWLKKIINHLKYASTNKQYVEGCVHQAERTLAKLADIEAEAAVQQRSGDGQAALLAKWKTLHKNRIENYQRIGKHSDGSYYKGLCDGLDIADGLIHGIVSGSRQSNTDESQDG